MIMYDVADRAPLQPSRWLLRDSICLNYGDIGHTTLVDRYLKIVLGCIKVANVVIRV